MSFPILLLPYSVKGCLLSLGWNNGRRSSLCCRQSDRRFDSFTWLLVVIILSFWWSCWSLSLRGPCHFPAISFSFSWFCSRAFSFFSFRSFLPSESLRVTLGSVFTVFQSQRSVDELFRKLRLECRCRSTFILKVDEGKTFALSCVFESGHTDSHNITTMSEMLFKIILRSIKRQVSNK